MLGQRWVAHVSSKIEPVIAKILERFLEILNYLNGDLNSPSLLYERLSLFVWTCHSAVTFFFVSTRGVLWGRWRGMGVVCITSKFNAYGCFESSFLNLSHSSFQSFSDALIKLDFHFSKSNFVLRVPRFFTNPASSTIIDHEPHLCQYWSHRFLDTLAAGNASRRFGVSSIIVVSEATSRSLP